MSSQISEDFSNTEFEISSHFESNIGWRFLANTGRHSLKITVVLFEMAGYAYVFLQQNDFTIEMNSYEGGGLLRYWIPIGKL